MQNKRTEPHKYPAHLPDLWKFLIFHRRTIGFLLSGAVIAAIAAAMRFPWKAAPSPLLHTQQQPQDLSAPAPGLSARAITINPATQAITLEAIDSD